MRTFVRRAGWVFFWIVLILQAAAMVDAGWGKFDHFDGWQVWFAKWGYGAWTAQVIGVVEILGGLLLLVPRLASYSASVLIAVMVVAFYTVTTKESDLSWFDPLLGVAMLSIVLVVRWGRRWRPSTGTIRAVPRL